MQDFIRIRGEIVSSPLNENFRRLLNQINISNTNLVFPEENAIVETIDEMNNIKEPVDAQTCYVISSGEFYRYTKKTNEWLKIMDIGQTFRQGFLNSGAVVLEGPMELADTSLVKIKMPTMLVYFKNREGSGSYLRGMYKIDEKIVNITNSITGSAGAYSIYVDWTGEYTITSGMPAEDDVNHIYIGTFLVNSSGKIIQAKDANNNVLSTCLYTLPDIAYTADRGNFLVNGGQASGMSLIASGNGDAKANRLAGFYYDEGINYTIGQTDEYPADNDNGSGFNIKSYEAQSPVPYFIYLSPENGLSQEIETDTILRYNKYWKDGRLADVPKGYFTIQQHLVTPTGQNIIVYGTQLYNSIMDAESNINATYGLNLDFPYVEATRIILGQSNEASKFTTDDVGCCIFHTMGRISQVGTISPEFADNIFKIYSGDSKDVTPSTIKFDLNALQKGNVNDLYSLGILPKTVTRQLFASDSKYITDANIQNPTPTRIESRGYGNPSVIGYEIADAKDLEYAINRIGDIEEEIWGAINNSSKQRHEQSIRYRLYHLEDRVQNAENTIINQEGRITYVEQNKVHKGTKINGYTLGNNTSNTEKKEITLTTKDINEPTGAKETDHWWFTQARVSANTDVKAAKAHVNTISKGTADATLTKSSVAGHTQVNPHNLSTDDLVVLQGSQKVFVTPAEERRIRSDRLPENTISELNKKIENIAIETVDRAGKPTSLGNVTTLQIHEHGANVTVDNNTNTATIECVGQVDTSDFLLKSEFAIEAKNNATQYSGWVDKAIYAENVSLVKDAGPEQYYGTDKNKNIGVFDLPTWVSTADVSEGQSFVDVEQATFVPIDGSITLKHLADGRATYTDSNEETSLNTNVYDLVKHHYHKVYNNGLQGPYVEGSESVQDTSGIKFEYKVPSGGLKNQTYYFTYENTTYSFSGTTAMVTNTLLIYRPYQNTLVYKLPNSTTETTITITKITNTTSINKANILPFVSTTDWNKINEWNFGDTLTVNVHDGRATINVKDANASTTKYTNYFANLADVDVDMNEDNLGRLIGLRKTNNELKLQFIDAPLNNYMLISEYVDSIIDKKVKLAKRADLADVATTANELQGKYSVNDGGLSNSTLWSSTKIQSNTTAQIKAEGVNTYYGTTAPTTVQGAKNGDLYIMIEG